MTFTYAQQYTMSQDAQFQARLTQSVVNAAAAIASSTLGSTTYSLAVYEARQALASAIMTKGSAAYIQLFASLVASQAGIVADMASAVPVPVASSTAAVPSVITTASPHGLSTGQIAEITGHLVNTAVNGTWPVTVLTTTTFSVPVAGSGTGAASGTVTLQPPDADLDTAVASVWSDVAGATAGT